MLRTQAVVHREDRYSEFVGPLTRVVLVAGGALGYEASSVNVKYDDPEMLVVCIFTAEDFDFSSC